MIKRYKIVETVYTYIYSNNELETLLEHSQIPCEVPVISKSEQQVYTEYKISCDNCGNTIGAVYNSVKKLKPYTKVDDKILCKNCVNNKS